MFISWLASRMVIFPLWSMSWLPKLLDLDRTNHRLEVAMLGHRQRYRLSRMKRVGNCYVMKYPFRLFRYYPDVPVTLIQLEDIGPVE